MQWDSVAREGPPRHARRLSTREGATRPRLRRPCALMELRSGQRLGDMVAQLQDPRSPPVGRDASAPVQAALIQAPATPVLAPQEHVRKLIDISDPSNRRPQPGTPLYTESIVAGQDGPLQASLRPPPPAPFAPRARPARAGHLL